jgi:transcription factor C subunit 6
MRTRRTNKTKRYTDYGFGLDDDGNGGEQSPGTANDDLSDDNFEAGDVDNDMSAQEDDESELDDEAVDLSDHEAPKNTPRPSKARETSRATTPAKHVIEYHKLPAYPLDPRISTRAYTGPLKRGARANILRDILYGPEFSKVKLVWELMERWTKYPVLPPRFPPQHPEGVLPSPWMPLGFELDQMKAACKWYDEYMVQSSDVPRSHPVLPKHGERLVPQAHGDVTVLLGPAENQKEYRFHQGAGKALSGSSLPVDDPENPDKGPNGWMFDVGGIVVALGWAPILTGDKQILALAVIPHSDQVKSMAEPDDITLEDEKKNGCVQFWEFEWERGEELQPRPSQKPPRFILAKCFDWGRPKRMQWCPVSFAMVGLYGILAVLCGDGRVRVVDVKAVQGSEQTSYGKSPLSLLS